MHKQERKRVISAHSEDDWSSALGVVLSMLLCSLTYEKQLCKDASYLHLFRRVSQPYIRVILSCLQSMKLVHFNGGRFLNLG